MKAIAPALLLLVTGCGSKPVVTESVNEAAESGPGPAPANAPQRGIGTTSALSGTTSPLTGTVSNFLVERTDTDTRVALAADTLFAFDKADLAPAAQANLQRTADLVRKGGAGAVTITGYTDAKGEDSYNLDLSRRRADAVATWLKGQSGLGERTFTTVGKGEADPVAPNARADGSDDPDGRARNRRVVVVIPR